MNPGGWAARGSPADGPLLARGQVRQVGAGPGLGAAAHLPSCTQSQLVAP